MNRRRTVIGLVVFAAVLVGVVFFQEPAPADAITVQFRSIETNTGPRFAICVASNASRQNFTLRVFAEHLTNGSFARVAPSEYLYVDWAAGSNGFVLADLPADFVRCRAVVEYQVAPRTKLGKMFEPIRTRLLGERPIMHSYSEEFHTPP